MPDVEVRGGWVQSQLHTHPVAALETCAKVILDMDLHRPLAEALEELATHITITR